VQQQIDNFESSNNKTFKNIVDIIGNFFCSYHVNQNYKEKSQGREKMKTKTKNKK